MFSVIIPSYNREYLLKNTVESVQNQTFQPDEIIIVNNGNSNININIFENVRGIKVLNTVVKAGASQARNIGATVAKSPWLAFLDDDDVWDKNYLEHAKERIAQKDTKCILGVIYKRDKNNNDTLFQNPSGKLDLENLLRKNPGAGGSNVVIEKETFLKLGGFDISLITGEDKALLIEFICKCESKVIVDKKMHVYINRNENIKRLTNPETMSLGIRAFLYKYRKYMSRSQIRKQNIRIAKYDYKKNKGVKKITPLFRYFFYKIPI